MDDHHKDPNNELKLRALRIESYHFDEERGAVVIEISSDNDDLHDPFWLSICDDGELYVEDHEKSVLEMTGQTVWSASSVDELIRVLQWFSDKSRKA